MNEQQAIEYGKSIGVKYHILTEYGVLLGGYTTAEQAERKRLEWVRKFEESRYCKGVGIHIVKVD